MSWASVSPARRQLAESVLTPLQLRILKLRIDGQSYRRIAIDVGKDESTVRYHYDRALARLHDATQSAA